MSFLPKLKYFLLASLGFLFAVAPAYAAATPNATRASELKLKSCQARQETVKTRMGNLVRMATTMMGVFDGIDMRVEEFYQNKVVAKGGSVPDYDKMVQEVKAKKEAVNQALNVATSDTEKFSCDTDNPKDTLTTFGKDMQQVKNALKEYRTSIKNLIVAVKGAYRALPTAVPTEAVEK